MTRQRIAIIGANGYGGGEVARLLATHPSLEVASYSSRQFEGQAFTAAWPGATDSRTFLDLKAAANAADTVVLALPNGVAMTVAPGLLAEGKQVLDLSADYRLPARDYETWYGAPHANPELAATAVYGLPEINRASVEGAQLVANPGCFVTATALGLLPLARAGLVGPQVIVDGYSGISGAGRNAAGFSFAEVNENVFAYKVAGTHRHTPEMEANLERCGASARVTFTPHVAPYSRGILVTAYVTPTRAVTNTELRDLYAGAYANEPFVRVVDEPPQVKATTGTNRCDVYSRLDERSGVIVVLSALDNLVKGMAGQAIQNLNLMLGCSEAAGLPTWASWP